MGSADQQVLLADRLDTLDAQQFLDEPFLADLLDDFPVVRVVAVDHESDAHLETDETHRAASRWRERLRWHTVERPEPFGRRAGSA